MGTIFVDNLEPQSGTSLTLGASGDTVSLGSGGTVTNTPAFFGTKASVQSVSRASYTKVTGFTNNEIDSDSAFDGTTFTVPSGKGGKYIIFFHMWADYATSAGSDGEYSIASIYVNGSAIERSFFELPGTTNVTQHHVNVSAIRTLSAGDTVEAYAYLKDENGGSADVQADFCSFYGYRLVGV